MTRRSYRLLAAMPIVMAIALAGSLAAKAPTAKITITGGRLAKPLEVTDPQVLGRFNPWFGGFIDPSVRVVTAPAEVTKPYEVSFYVKLSSDDIRKMYVLYYHPNVSDEEGTLYLPRRGEKWHQLNASTIMRRTGWFYASREWEARIKPLISSAEAAQRSASAPSR